LKKKKKEKKSIIIIIIPSYMYEQTVKEGKVERLKNASLAAAKESERLRGERNALMKELDDSKKKNDDVIVENLKKN
jgi:hypothetical protein